MEVLNIQHMPNMEINLKLFDQLPPSASCDLSANKLHIYHYFLPSGKLVGSQKLASRFFFFFYNLQMHKCL